jgi:1-acyl-sn-glycerol-3-phosphate acyltransferase
MLGNSITVAPGDTAPVAGRSRLGFAGCARSVLRSLAFGAALAGAAIVYPFITCGARADARRRRRAWWLHCLCRVLTRVVGLRLRARGAAARSGLIVSSHLSYLDIVAYSALMPCVFVAKQEVRDWPVFGCFARLAGTVFVDRQRRTAVAGAGSEIADALRAGMPVVLFAEGTSSDGRQVLPFRSSLLEPAARSRELLTPAAISYDLADGSPAGEVCYWGEMTLLPHLLHLFTKRRIEAEIAFGVPAPAPPDGSRKQLARDLHGVVCLLHATLLDGRSMP